MMKRWTEKETAGEAEVAVLGNKTEKQGVCVHVRTHVCVTKKERERERESDHPRQNEWLIPKRGAISSSVSASVAWTWSG